MQLYILILFCLVTSIFLIAIFLSRRVYGKKEDSDFRKKAIRILYRQSARYALAAYQDKAEIIAVLHANYAAGYLWSIKDIVSSQEFQKITGVSLLEWEEKISKIQDSVTKRLIQKCPSLIFHKDKLLVQAMMGN